MNDRRCFVQFIHPGGEHSPDHDDCKHWNLDEHKRKFLKALGRYRRQPTEPDHKGAIVFWGEWEAESRVVKRFQNNASGAPRFLYEPCYLKPSQYSGWGQVIANGMYGAVVVDPDPPLQPAREYAKA